MVWLLLIAFGVGVLTGAVGVGGILLIPALNILGGLAIHQAMATALFSFILTGVAGSWLFQRRGSIDWKLTVPVCLAAVPCSFFGAWVNSKFNAPALSLLLSLLIALAGIYMVRRSAATGHEPFTARPAMRQALLSGVGAFAGFGSGLTGVGGPALSVPIMVLCGFAPLTVIGTSQVLQILAATSGTLGNLQYGSIDFRMAIIVMALQIVGVFFGVRVAHTVKPAFLRRFVGVLCVLVGTGLTVRALANW